MNIHTYFYVIEKTQRGNMENVVSRVNGTITTDAPYEQVALAIEKEFSKELSPLLELFVTHLSKLE